MLFLTTGSAGFLFMLLFDWADARGWKLKWIFPPVAALLVLFSCIALAVGENRFFVPVALRILGWLFTGIFLVLLVFSLFLEIPLAQSYRKTTGMRHVTQTGTYALVRHPGVLWFFFLTLSLVPASGSVWLLAAVPLWTVLNVCLVLVEDKIFFPEIFGAEYRQYTHRVPFLIPTPSSVRACLSSLVQRKD